MTTQWITSLAQLTDQTLLARVTDLARRERRATVALLAHLAELDERRLYLDDGCSSLFTWCTERLHFSEHAAYNRIECARVARRFPLILERLADGSVHLTAVRLLAPHLTPANHRDLLDRARHCGKRQVEELIAEVRPRPDVPSTVRRLPGTAGHGSPDPAGDAAVLFTVGAESSSGERLVALRSAELPGASTVALESATQATAVPPPRSAVIAPLAPGRYRVQFTADEEMHRDLQAAREMLRHQVPNGDPAVILKMALKLLVARARRTKFAATDRQRPVRAGTRSPVPASAPACNPVCNPARGANPSRHIPAAIRRAVAERDAGRCTFRAADGRRCTAAGHLEFHHLEPFAAGGPTTIDNVALRCRAHNAHESRRYFGRLVPERVHALTARRE